MRYGTNSFNHNVNQSVPAARDAFPPSNFENFSVTRKLPPTLPFIANKSVPSLNGNEVEKKAQSPFLTIEEKENLESLMSANDMKDGMMLFNIEARYFHQFKKALEWKKAGFNSLEECLKTVPSILTLIPCGHTFKVVPFDKSNSSPQQQQEIQQTNGYNFNNTDDTIIHSYSVIFMIKIKRTF